MMSYYYGYFKKLLEAEKEKPAEKEPSPVKVETTKPALVFAKVPPAIKGRIIGVKAASVTPAVKRSRPQEDLVKQYPALKKFKND
jgi:hypothetical protein